MSMLHTLLYVFPSTTRKFIESLQYYNTKNKLNIYWAYWIGSFNHKFEQNGMRSGKSTVDRCCPVFVEIL